MKTREYLDTAAKIVTGQRQRDYGNKYENHKNISDLWSAYLGKEVSAHDMTDEEVAKSVDLETSDFDDSGDMLDELRDIMDGNV